MADVYVDDLPPDWETGFSGQSWFKRDKYGNDWQVYIEDGALMFRAVSEFPLAVGTLLTEEEFKELFE